MNLRYVLMFCAALLLVVDMMAEEGGPIDAAVHGRSGAQPAGTLARADSPAAAPAPRETGAADFFANWEADRVSEPDLSPSLAGSSPSSPPGAAAFAGASGALTHEQLLALGVEEAADSTFGG